MQEVSGSNPLSSTTVPPAPVVSVYILLSETRGRFYVGVSENPERRLLEHKAGKTPSTRGRGPWTLVYREPFDSRADAVRREREIKAWKSAKAIRTLIGE